MTDIAVRTGDTIATLAPVQSAPNVAVAALMDWAQSASAAHEIATHLVRTSFVPEGFRGKPDEATAAILAGIEVGLQPMAALRSFDVIQGTAAPRANTLRAIVQSQGHDVWVVESTETRAIVAGQRRGSTQEQRSVWTIDRAKRLGLTGKKNWQAQPQAMLVARATAELCRLIASDAILGLPYSIEELVDGDDLVAAEVVALPAKRRTAKRSTAKPATATVERIDAPVAPEPQYDEPPFDDDSVAGAGETDDSTTPPGAEQSEAPATGPTEGQNRLMHRMFGDLGITDRAERLEFTSAIVGRVLTSSTELTRADASRLIDHMARELGEVAPDEDPS